MKKILLAGMALALLAASPAFAETMQGQIPGGSLMTAKMNKNGAFIAPGNDSNDWYSSNDFATTTPVAIKAAPGAGLKACIDFIDVEGVSATTAATLAIKSGTTLMFNIQVAAGAGQKVLPLRRPICAATNAAINAVLSGGTTGNVTVNATGFTVVP